MIFPVLIQKVLEYDIKDSDGKGNDGISVHYTVLGEPENTPSSKGNEPVKGSIPMSQRLELKAVPGYYNMEFTMGTVKNAQGRTSPGLKPKAIEFICAAPFFKELPGKMPLPPGVDVRTSPVNQLANGQIK